MFVDKSVPIFYIIYCMITSCEIFFEEYVNEAEFGALQNVCIDLLEPNCIMFMNSY